MKRWGAFSLVEVVVALGVIAFAIVAIIGLVPTGLQTSHSSQDETRAAQIAQLLFASLVSQSQTQFENIQLPVTPAAPLDLSKSTSTATAPAVQLYADNSGQLSTSAVGASYSVAIITNNSPAGFDATYANLVTISVGWPAGAPAASRTTRDFVRIVSKY
jgi:uncharacterized protein (TIGR02598 family)